MSYQVLARKWRPHRFQEMVGQEHVLRMLMNALDNQRLHHAYLFTGTRGVGKTTLARLLAKCLNCETGITSQPCDTCKTCTAIDAGRFLDLIEIDAASRTKVEDTRELLADVQYLPNQGRYKIYLIDEVHMLSGHSFNALLKTLEEPPPQVKFLLATTDPKRLPITILSRCLQFNLKRVPIEQITQQLQHICTAENIQFEIPALQLLAHAADGSMRDALSLLDQAIAFCRDNITTIDIRDMLGSIEQDVIFRLLDALANQNGEQLLNHIKQLAEQAPNFSQVLEDVAAVLHRTAIAQITTLPEQDERITALAARLSKEDVQLYYQIAIIGRRDLPLAPNPQYGFEMIMLRMLAFQPAIINTAVTNTPPVNNNITISSNNWGDILPKLELSGMALALASNCSLEKITDTQVDLVLLAAHEPMLNKKLTDRIEESLTNYFKKPIKLTIKITAAAIDTPHKKQQLEKETRHATATDAITSDNHVQKMIDMFGATIDINSIKSTS